MTRLERLRRFAAIPRSVFSVSNQTADKAGADLAWLLDSHAELVRALEAAETMLRCLPDTTTNAGGAKPVMTTTGALALVRAALTNAKETNDG